MLLAVVSIPVERLLLSLLPILATAVLYFKWATGLKTLLYATARMLGQLVAVGFALNFIYLSQLLGQFDFIFSRKSFVLPRDPKGCFGLTIQ